MNHWINLVKKCKAAAFYIFFRDFILLVLILQVKISQILDKPGLTSNVTTEGLLIISR